MTDIPRIAIAAGKSDAPVAKILAHTIEKNASGPVEIVHTYDLPRPFNKGYPSPPVYPKTKDPTPFSFVRAWLPKLFEYEGRAIYTEVDQLCFGDIYDVWNAPMNGHPVVAPPNGSSFFMVDCSAVDWDVDELIAKLRKGEGNYRWIVGLLCGTLKKETMTLPKTWNSLDRYEPGVTKLLHYTARQRQPWHFPGKHPHENVWVAALISALNAEVVSKDEVNQLAIWPTVKRARAKAAAR